MHHAKSFYIGSDYTNKPFIFLVEVAFTFRVNPTSTILLMLKAQLCNLQSSTTW